MNEIEWFEEEQRVFKKREKLKTPEWAEKHIKITAGSMKGPFRNSVTPYLTGVMDIFDLPWVRKVVIRKGVQTGVTTAAHVYVLHEGEKTSDSSLIIMGDEKNATKMMKKRIHPMINNSELMSSLKSQKQDDFAIYSVLFSHGFQIDIAWSNSSSALSSHSYRIVVTDELDKAADFASGEAGVISQVEGRVTAYPDTSKIIEISTPTIEDGPVSRDIETCDVLLHFEVYCPLCGVRQEMVFDQFRWPDDKDKHQIRSKKLASYECIECKGLWNDNIRDKAVKNGELIPNKEVDRPESIGVDIPGWLSRFVSLSKIVYEWIEANEEAERGNDSKLMAWWNFRAGLPYKKEKPVQEVNSLVTLKSEELCGIVRKGTTMLTMAVDSQKSGFYYEVRGWFPGMALSSDQIRYGFTDSFQGLLDIANGEYKDSENNRYIVGLAGIDSGGGQTGKGESTITWQVYDFCSANPLFRALKGRNEQSAPYKVSNLEFFPNSNRPIPGGLQLWIINVTHYKNMLSAKLNISQGDPGCWNLLNDVSDDYIAQMCAEYRDEKGFWQTIKNRHNHYWDVGVYNLALADMGGVKFGRAKTEEKEENQQSSATKKLNHGDRFRTARRKDSHLPNWFKNRNF